MLFYIDTAAKFNQKISIKFALFKLVSKSLISRFPAKVKPTTLHQAAQKPL